MYTKTRNNRKKRLKQTNSAKSLEISKATETKLPVNAEYLQALFYSHFLRIHNLRLVFCKVWKVGFVINIMFIILKSLFDIGSCSTSIFSRINTLK